VDEDGDEDEDNEDDEDIVSPGHSQLAVPFG
jgi:hypothetical protein